MTSMIVDFLKVLRLLVIAISFKGSNKISFSLDLFIQLSQVLLSLENLLMIVIVALPVHLSDIYLPVKLLALVGPLRLASLEASLQGLSKMRVAD